MHLETATMRSNSNLSFYAFRIAKFNFSKIINFFEQHVTKILFLCLAHQKEYLLTSFNVSVWTV